MGGAVDPLLAAAMVVKSRARSRSLAALAWALWAVAMAILALIPVSDQLLRNAGRPDLVQFTIDTIPPFVSAVSAATVGAVLAHRRPRHPVGWLLLALTTCLVITGVTAQYVVYDLLIGPDALPAIQYIVRFHPATVIAAFVLLSFVLLLTPTGALPSTRWRWWANGTIAALAVCLAAVMLAPGGADPQDLVKSSPVDGRSFSGALRLAIEVGAAVGVLTTVVAAGSLAARFRRARGVERQQLRWVAIAAALTVLTAPAAVATSAPDVVSWSGGLSFAVVPMALGAAVLRYRLYEIDRLVSRTITYAIVVAMLAGVYVVVIGALTRVLPSDSDLAVAVSTGVAYLRHLEAGTDAERGEGAFGPPETAMLRPPVPNATSRFEMFVRARSIPSAVVPTGAERVTETPPSRSSPRIGSSAPVAKPISDARVSTSTKMIDAHRPRVRLTPAPLRSRPGGTVRRGARPRRGRAACARGRSRSTPGPG